MSNLSAAAVLLLAPSLALSLAAPAAPAAAPTPDRVVALLRDDARTEVEAGLMAQRRARTDGVRRLGRVLERDGRLAEARVMALARGQGLRVGESPGSDEERAMLVRLEGVPDAQFDAEFLYAVSGSRARALEALRPAAAAAPDRRLAGLVRRLLPVIRQERSLAESLSARGGAAGGG